MEKRIEDIKKSVNKEIISILKGYKKPKKNKITRLDLSIIFDNIENWGYYSIKKNKGYYKDRLICTNLKKECIETDKKLYITYSAKLCTTIRYIEITTKITQ